MNCLPSTPKPAEQALSLEARDALRQQQSRPLLGVIQKQIEAARSAALPGRFVS
jgi:hypothetical protein